MGRIYNVSGSRIINGPKIVTNGLVLYLDAADRNSYVSGSTTWRDLSGNNNSGSLINGPTFNSANGGSIVLDGLDDYVICTNDASVQISVGTIGAWIKADNTNFGFNGIITKRLAWGLFVTNNFLEAYDWGNNRQRTTGIIIGNSTWNYVAMSFTGTPPNNAIIYLNGNAVLTTTNQVFSQSTQVEVGEGGSQGQSLSGNVSMAHIYNRVLSAQEILQNYNAQKLRFNL